MTDRDKLIRRLNDWGTVEAEPLADFLLANDVIVPPCKVGDKIYILYSVTKEIEECEVTGLVIQTKHDVIKFKDGSIYTIWDKDYDAHFGKTIFLTKEEAEQKLKELGK